MEEAHARNITPDLPLSQYLFLIFGWAGLADGTRVWGMEYPLTMAARGPGLEGYGVLLSRTGQGVMAWNYLSLRLSYVPHNDCCIYSHQLVAWVGGVIRIRPNPEQTLGDCEMNLGDGR
jgi:hypothetical protein